MVVIAEEQTVPRSDFDTDLRTLRRSSRLKTAKAINYSFAPSPIKKRKPPVSRKTGRVEKRKMTSTVHADQFPEPENSAGGSDKTRNVQFKEDAEVVAHGREAAVADPNAYSKVTETLRTFNKHYLHSIQEENKRCAKTNVKKSSKSKKSKEEEKRCANQKPEKTKNVKRESKSKKSKEKDRNKSRRPDLKALTKMIENGTILSGEKRIGSIPGIDVGHQFYSRAEMHAVGFHNQTQSGIDYIGKTTISAQKAAALNLKRDKLPLAICVVLSGQYEDDIDNREEVVYIGQGGNDLLGTKEQISNQKMERGNLALKNCIKQKVPIRLVRGHDCESSYVKKVYTYDGLYMVDSCWADTGVSGFTIYKFRLKRLEGQPSITTEQVRFTRGRTPKSVSELRGLVCEDITGGLEAIQIPVTDVVTKVDKDSPIMPPELNYINKMKISNNICVPTSAPPGCNCKGQCKDPSTCACAKLNGGDFPYVDGGRLVEAKGVVFECGPNCGCGPECVNRTSQSGPKFRFEIFRTPNKGWGVRSWDHIPSGSPICEYIGLLRKTDDLDPAADNSYVFDIDCLQTMNGLDGRERRLRDVSLPSNSQKAGEEVPYCIDAGQTGNFARFINHSCRPNLFVQCMLNEHYDISLARIILIAADNIPPLKELTYDYGYALDSVMDPEGNIKQMACYCGAEDCRKRMY